MGAPATEDPVPVKEIVVTPADPSSRVYSFKDPGVWKISLTRIMALSVVRPLTADPSDCKLKSDCCPVN